MLLVGLTGGVATGKSTVARMFQECGAYVLDADQFARQVVAPGKPAWREVVRTFGRRILNPDRTLDRVALGRLVFHDPRKLRRLGRIIHPRVAREQARATREIARRDPHAVIIYDAPVLIEAGAHTRMDRIVVVTADQETQVARLMKRNGLGRTEALRRIRSQMPLREKLTYADAILDGRLPPARLQKLVAGVYGEFFAVA